MAGQRFTNGPNTANAIKDTTSWAEPRTLENLPGFLEAFSEDAKTLGEAPEENGSPHSIIVAAAGLRAADVVRYVICILHRHQCSCHSYHS